MLQATQSAQQLGITLTELLEYTDWERERWRALLTQHGDQVLKISAGGHGDGRFTTTGDIIRHIFSAEKRYIDRLSDRELTDPSTIPADNADALFRFGEQSRSDLKQFIAKCPADTWEFINEFSMVKKTFRATTRKVIVHVIMHEIRHWAQVGTMLRQNGYQVDFQDFILSPVMGDAFASNKVA